MEMKSLQVLDDSKDKTKKAPKYLGSLRNSELDIESVGRVPNHPPPLSVKDRVKKLDMSGKEKF